MKAETKHAIQELAVQQEEEGNDFGDYDSFDDYFCYGYDGEHCDCPDSAPCACGQMPPHCMYCCKALRP